MLDYIWSVDDKQRGAAGGEPPKPECPCGSPVCVFARSAPSPRPWTAACMRWTGIRKSLAEMNDQSRNLAWNQQYPSWRYFLPSRRNRLARPTGSIGSTRGQRLQRLKPRVGRNHDGGLKPRPYFPHKTPKGGEGANLENSMARLQPVRLIYVPMFGGTTLEGQKFDPFVKLLAA